MSFLGKVVLITGASSGIGRETAIKFSKLGASLALSGRNSSALDEVSKECGKAAQKEPLIVLGDITNESIPPKIMKDVVGHFRQLDVLVNCAGILENGSIENTSLEQYDRMFNINVRCIYHLTMLAVPHLVKTKGNIVNVSSVAGSKSFPNVLSYCMSKAAIDQFTRCTALELAPKGVRVNAVNPGVIITELHKRAGMQDDAYKQFLERSKETHALGRPGQASEVADVITFLASDSASYITAENVHVDGGRHAMCPR
ncbi:hypothetical protein RUM44_005284 [Polyplax serrata]|uniref:Ketoreductase domain-containing protein n=1 Tax=Polyplax serrata TaxID=468196 RepID=A0ABR1AF13_POLSC